MKPEGYTILLGLVHDKKASIVRREDGFERRVLSRCARCNLVIGYELAGDGGGGEAVDVDGGNGKGKEAAWFTGRIMYLLPGGVMSTEVMNGETRVGEEDVDVRKGGIVVFE